MTDRKIYGADFGPYIYDDAIAILNYLGNPGDEDGDFAGMLYHASITNGGHILGFADFLDTDHSHLLTLKWNENDTGNRVLNLLVAGGDRSLTVEGDSIVNQDLTTDAAPTFGGLTQVGDATNKLMVAADGEVTLGGTARVMRSIDLTPIVVKRPAANPPAENTEDGFPTHDFDDTTDESVYFIFKLPHDYAAGGAIDFHVENFVDTAPADGTVDNVSFGLEYKKQSVGDNFDFGASTTPAYMPHTITTGTPANDKKIHTCGGCPITTTGFVVGDYLLMRFFRDATGTGGADNLVGDLRAFGYHLEYLSDRHGEAT